MTNQGMKGQHGTNSTKRLTHGHRGNNYKPEQRTANGAKKIVGPPLRIDRELLRIPR